MSNYLLYKDKKEQNPFNPIITNSVKALNGTYKVMKFNCMSRI